MTPTPPPAENSPTGAPGEIRASNPPRLVETHTAVLIFIGDRVYKLKKPVDLGFLDFRLLATRRAACEAEVELNSRLAPDVYLGVADVLGPQGETMESLVVMRRMPADRRLSTLVTADPEGPLPAGALDSLSRLIADFHSRCPTSPQIAASADPEVLRSLWRDNVSALRRHAGRVVDKADIDRVEALAIEYLEGREPLLRLRQQRGHVRDGHGDLLADDIFVLDDGPRVLDCLEFDAALRCCDVLNDVACLAMDLERLGAATAARRFLDTYAQSSGEHHPRSLEDHYIAYRAGVRAKVACLRWSQGDETARTVAQQLTELALGHLQRARVCLALVGGLPGSGKSTVAEALSKADGGAQWTLLRSDVVRKELAGLDPTARTAAAYGAGDYQDRSRRSVYAEVFRRAELALGLGENVIIDATFVDADERTTARRIATRTSSVLIELECRAPVDAIAERLSIRATRQTDPSDADLDISLAMSARRAPWPSARAIDTSGSIEQSVVDARSAIESAVR